MATDRERKRWQDIGEEIKHLESFKTVLKGTVDYKGQVIGAELDRKNGHPIFRLGMIDNNKLNDEQVFLFGTGGFNYTISGTTTAHRNTVKVKEGWASRYTEGVVDEMRSARWRNSKGRFRSYYHASGKNLLYHTFENRHALELKIDHHRFYLFQEDHHLVIESFSTISLAEFNEISYAILVALGFVSGEFIQDEVFTFRITANGKAGPATFTYRTLRKGGASIYQAVLWNPFGYEHYIGRKLAEKMYKEKTLAPLDVASFTTLVLYILQNHQIKYALVLFNDANESTQSLLVRNNCFFTVMEVLRKFFYEIVKDKLPNSYSQKGNIEKFKMVFEMITPVNEDEAVTLAKRNTFLHGGIKDIEGAEMMEVMLKQIALIHKLMMTYIGFKGHVIDHYQLRSGPPGKAFVPLNQAGK
jgi:hypothetical protein